MLFNFKVTLWSDCMAKTICSQVKEFMNKALNYSDLCFYNFIYSNSNKNGAVIQFVNMEQMPQFSDKKEIKKDTDSLSHILKAAAFAIAIGNTAPAMSSGQADARTRSVETETTAQNNYEVGIPANTLKSAENIDPYILILQQQIRDLQMSGKMKIKNKKQRARGARLPFDAGYDPKIDGAPGMSVEEGEEYIQKVTTENATEEQVKNLEEYMKNKSGWVKKVHQEMEDGKNGKP